MEKYNLKDIPKDSKLVQLISKDLKLQITDDANVFYAMASSGNYHFLLTKQNFLMGTNANKGGCLTILQRIKKRLPTSGSTLVRKVGHPKPEYVKPGEPWFMGGYI
nr:ral guanine nucleotide dissociation stimulator-like [Dasypus novemcinctus]